MTSEFIATKADYMGPSPVTAYRSSTDILVQNTVAETDLFTYQAPAGAFSGDHGINAYLWGVRINSSGGTVAYRFKVYLGATLMYEHVASFFTT